MQDSLSIDIKCCIVNVVYDTSVKSIKILCKLACKRIYYPLTRKKYERIISIIIDYTLDKMFFQTKSKFPYS